METKREIEELPLTHEREPVTPEDLPSPKLTQDDKARMLLAEAGEYLKDHWVQGAYFENNDDNINEPLVCAVGALRHVAQKKRMRRSSPVFRKAMYLLARTMGSKRDLEYDGPESVIITFNDKDRRRKSTVYNRFKKAAGLDRK